jgi:hypothetical protein
MPRQGKQIAKTSNLKQWEACGANGKPVRAFGCFDEPKARDAAKNLGGFVRPVTPGLSARRERIVRVY